MSLDYDKARQLVLTAGLAVLLITAGVMYVRRVDTVEVAATLLFIPIFIGFVFWNTTGGLVAASLAIAAYIALRAPAIDAVGFDRFAGFIFSRGTAYLLFGAIGGLANRQLASSLTKLELYDQIDDMTGLYNARFFVQDTELEISRSQRYQTIFSLSLLDVPAAALAGLSKRRRSSVIKELSRMLRDSVRTVDRVVHCVDGEMHRFAVVLPETGTEGAGIFTARLADRVSSFLKERGAKLAEEGVVPQSLSFPQDGDKLETLRDEFRRVDRIEHPETTSVRTNPYR